MLYLKKISFFKIAKNYFKINQKIPPNTDWYLISSQINTNLSNHDLLDFFLFSLCDSF